MKTKCSFSIVYRGLMSGTVILLSACYCRSDTPAQTYATTDVPAGNLVRAALENELAGRNDQREALLEQALAQTPSDSAAHWQLGQVRVDDAWLTASQAEQSAQKDHRLAEYRRLRDAAGPTAEDQVALAKWCHKNKYYEEERLHLLLANQIQPGQPEAVQGLSSLGLHMYEGKLMTDPQIARAKNQAQKINKAMEQWRPFVTQWQRADDRRETSPPAEVREKIAQISEPADMLGLEWAILRQVDTKKDQRHRIALALVKTLEPNPQPVVAQFLVRQSVFSEFDDVRSAAATGLKKHPFDHYVPLLLSGLQTPIEADIRSMLSATGNLATQYSFYREGALTDFSTTITTGPQESAPNLPANGEPGQSAYGMAINQRRNAARSVVQANQQTAALRDHVQAINDNIEQRNARIVAVLTQTTGKDLGEDPTKWWDWWLQDYNGMYSTNGNNENATDSETDKPTYQPPPPPPAYESKPSKPVVYKNAFQGYQVYDAPQPTTGARAPGYQTSTRAYTPSSQPMTGGSAHTIQLPTGTVTWPHSCFSPGTKVWTLTGRMPIAQIKIGDRVLAQNVESGELAYKPVLAVTTQPPGTRMKIGLGADTITSTPSHPFWVLGEGWQMTKQLAVGKTMHTISGGVRVESIERQAVADQLPAEFAYNLIVDDFHTFFVGDQGILVHDNTFREPTAALVPGLLPQASDADKNHSQK
ncbi:MAG: polymorphic toxin-type HINT domain-containing protein [Thermoguttaceae bacterium]|jgi:hypothetical protein